MISDEERVLAEKVITMHDGKSYKKLQDVSMKPKTPDAENHITEDEYMGMCNELSEVKGIVGSIKLIDCIVREDNKLSLWRVTYSKSEGEVFWAIGFDRETQKVQDVLVQW